LEINISSGATIRRPIPKNTLLFPAFYNNKIYGLSPTGIGVFDLVTQTYTQLSTAAKADRPGFTYKNNSSLDAVNGRYFFLFDKQATGVCDTLGIYNMGLIRWYLTHLHQQISTLSGAGILSTCPGLIRFTLTVCIMGRFWGGLLLL
jgi:hypothetical protein